MHSSHITPLARFATAAVIGAVLGAGALALADDYRRFPGEAADNRTLDAQQKVEALYSSGEYGRALLIYERELAPLGDKYAQYMVGYMHLNGQGVERDKAAALAWYRLAAERGETPLRQAKSDLERSMEAEELARAEELFGRLWQQYGDRRLLLELISEDLKILGERNDSRFAESSSAATIVSGYFGTRSSEEFYRSVSERLERRTQYLESTASAGQAGAVSGSEALRKLEAEVAEGLEALKSR